MRAVLLLLCATATVFGRGADIAETNRVLHRAIEVLHAQTVEKKADVPFVLTGTVVFPNTPHQTEFALKDDTGTVLLDDSTSRRDVSYEGVRVRAGERIRVRGETARHPSGIYTAKVSSFERMGLGSPSEPQDISADDLRTGRYDYYSLVRLTGIVTDAFRDEIDRNCVFIVLACGRETAYAVFYSPTSTVLPFNELVGKQVSVTGLCQPRDTGARRLLGRIILMTGPESISTACTPSSDPFAVPDLPDGIDPDALAEQRTRYRLAGRVLAVWKHTRMLVKPDNGPVANVELLSPSTNGYGDAVVVSGIVATDLYRVNLTRAVARTVPNEGSRNVCPEVLPADRLRFNTYGEPGIDPYIHGKVLSLTGTILNLSPHEPGSINLDADGTLVTIDANNRPEILAGVSAGCRVRCTGILVLETTNWRPGAPFPHIGGIVLVPRTAADLEILAYPPWWTATRLIAVVGSLLAGLFGIFAWNIALRRKAERRGSELAAEQLAHVTSELKVNERTRLAVELHDALSQTLTGVSMQIDTAAGFAQGKSPAISKCLDLASRMIDACRMELRNTLWDLRSAALDEPTMDAAIRKALCRNPANVGLSVRFNVPRERFSDNTAHAILKIVRELAANALRHGKATSLAIAGTVDGDKVLFSVRDNGCGFDPDLVPGIGEGHFGLQGIAERLERLNGEMRIESTSGKGTKVTVSLPIPRSGE